MKKINAYDQFRNEMRIQLDKLGQNCELKLRKLVEIVNDSLNKNTNLMNLYITKSILLLFIVIF